MLRLLDAKTGSYTKVRPTRPGVLRVCAHVPGQDLTGLRVLLVADLITRAAELRRLQVLTALITDGGTAGTAAFQATASSLGIHPPVAQVSPEQPEEAEAALGGPIDVQLTADDPGPYPGLVARVGAARGDQAADPLALRSALLSVPWPDPADVTADALDAAGRTLKDWRRRVAEWATFPSGPMPAPLAERVRAAFDDLDTASALALLRDLAADETVPPGTRFETFVYVDRLLALELPRDIGQGP